MNGAQYPWPLHGTGGLHSPDGSMMALRVGENRLIVQRQDKPVVEGDLEQVYHTVEAERLRRTGRARVGIAIIAFVVHLAVNSVVLRMLDDDLLKDLLVCVVIGFPIYLAANRVRDRWILPRISRTAQRRTKWKLHTAGLDTSRGFFVDIPVLEFVRPGDLALMSPEFPDITRTLQERRTREHRERLYPNRPTYGRPGQSGPPT